MIINDFEFTLLASTKFIKNLIFHFLKVFFFPDFCKMIQKVPKKSKFWKCSCFLTDFGEIVLLSLKIFFTDVSQKSFTTCRSNFNPKKKHVFEARKSSKIDHLDGRHQCKFIFSFFSWNFGKSFKTLNFSNSYPQND